MKKLLPTLLGSVCLFLATPSFSQINAQTEDGKSVILKPDGTWSFTEATAPDQVAMTCEDVIEDSEDKMTGKRSTSAKSVLVISRDGGKNGFGIFCMQGTKNIIMSVQAVGAGCIRETSKCNVLFRDGSKLEMANDGDFNCKGDFTLYFGGVFGKKSQLSELASKEVETIRVWTSDGYVQEDLTIEQSKILMQTLKCLSE